MTCAKAPAVAAGLLPATRAKQQKCRTAYEENAAVPSAWASNNERRQQSRERSWLNQCECEQRCVLRTILPHGLGCLNARLG